MPRRIPQGLLLLIIFGIWHFRPGLWDFSQCRAWTTCHPRQPVAKPTAAAGFVIVSPWCPMGIDTYNPDPVPVPGPAWSIARCNSNCNCNACWLSAVGCRYWCGCVPLLLMLLLPLPMPLSHNLSQEPGEQVSSRFRCQSYLGDCHKASCCCCVWK